jgi:two-component system CheB/CheR fusion protein
MNRAVPRILRVITWFNTASAGRNLASSGWKAYPLNTVNAELQSKVPDLSRINNDMNNQLAGTGIGTIFVDHHLLILRFTPTVTKIINLIQSDMGRPVGHIVINTLIPKEVTIKTLVARSYTMRILPYRTLDNVIEGAVVTFFDITEIAQTREALRQANELLRLAVVVRTPRMPLRCRIWTVASPPETQARCG